MNKEGLGMFGVLVISIGAIFILSMGLGFLGSTSSENIFGAGIGSGSLSPAELAARGETPEEVSEDNTVERENELDDDSDSSDGGGDLGNGESNEEGGIDSVFGKVVLETQITKCDDLDGGINYFTRGRLIGVDNSGREIAHSDGCLSDEVVIEYHCASEEVLGRRLYTCPNGCDDGACRVEKQSVEDADETPSLEDSDREDTDSDKSGSEPSVDDSGGGSEDGGSRDEGSLDSGDREGVVSVITGFFAKIFWD